jgi:toxin ParE1/3/4
VTAKQVIPREAAQRDIDQAIAHYAAEAGEPVAVAFIDALERAFRRIAQHPAVGSPRYAFELRLDGLRAWPLRRYPYLVFYVEREDHLDVWRVLHTQRDIPAWMQDPEGAKSLSRISCGTSHAS